MEVHFAISSMLNECSEVVAPMLCNMHRNLNSSGREDSELELELIPFYSPKTDL